MRTLATHTTRPVEDTQPALSITQDPEGLRVTLRGTWTADALSAPAVWLGIEAQWRTVAAAVGALKPSERSPLSSGRGSNCKASSEMICSRPG